LEEEEEGSNHEVDPRTRTWRQAGSDEEFRSLRSDSVKVNGESRIWVYGMPLKKCLIQFGKCILLTR
jgi:hypothetical protein